MNTTDDERRRVKIETAVHEQLIDTFRPPFTESKGRVRRVLTDIVFAGETGVWRARGRDDFADFLHGQCEDHLAWETQMEDLEESEIEAWQGSA